MPMATTDTPAAFFPASRTEKPWGYELIYADGRAGYAGKVIHVAAGESLSLQLHEEKDETITVLSGMALFEHGRTPNGLSRRVMEYGDTVHVPALTVHRITAITELLFAEASTARPGWRDDVIRLEDRYGRKGTSQP
jgi:mannose-6-phosphate isomerase